MLFFIIFIIIPLIEFMLFVKVSEIIGLGTALLLSLLTALLGGMIIKKQGLKVFFDAQNTLNEGALPLKALFDGFCIVIAGATLVTPGFFTDFIGFLLLLPPFRAFLMNVLPKILDIQVHDLRTGGRTRTKQEPHVIDVEFERMDDDR